MTTEIEAVDQVIIARVVGRVDAYTSPALDEALRALPGVGHDLVLDLGGADYLSSAGLRVLLGLAKRARAEAFRLRLSGMRPAVAEVLDIAGFVPLFEIRDTADAAVVELATEG